MTILEINYQDESLVQRLDEAVIDTATAVASDINNANDHVAYLHSNGWTTEQINKLIRDELEAE